MVPYILKTDRQHLNSITQVYRGHNNIKMIKNKTNLSDLYPDKGLL